MGVVVASISSATAQDVVHNAATAAAGGPTRDVIVVLRNQHTDLTITKGRAASARVNAYRSDQAPLLDRARTSGARNLHGYAVFNGFSATVTTAQADQLAADPSVAAVYPDLPVRGVPVTHDAIGNGATPNANPVTAVCPSDPAHPLLEPEALQVTNDAFDDPSTPSAQQIVDGSGVKVAWIADGIDINNPDFIRADSSHVFVDYQDFSGDGPNAPSGAAEAFGDASSIAAQGRQTYDLSNFVNAAHPLPPGCNIRVLGMAPGASLIGLKVFGNSNSAPTSRFIQAIEYAVTDGADVLNESFGGNPFPDTGDDPISLADNAAIAAGVTVVASSGDSGPTNTIGSPGSSGQVIDVAATTTFRSYIQDTFAGAQLSDGTWVSNNISGLSSGGITQSGRTPDLAAPGDLGWALCSTDTSLYEECTNDNGDPSPIQNFGGTSQSAPLTSGAAALVIEAYENTHGGVRPTPALVREILTSTATDLGHPAYEQGAGLLNALAAVKAAQSWHDANGSPARVGNTLLVDKNQLTAISNPNTSISQTIKITNNGTGTQTVHATTRTLGNVVSTLTGKVTLNTKSANTPFYIDSFGISRSFATQTFNVGHVDRLDVSVASQSSPFAIRIILLDPNGVYTAYSIPQGANNFAHVDVRFPTPGTWTAFFALSTGSGFSGTLPWKVVTSDFTTRGSVSPSSFTLAPGASKTVTVNSWTDPQPGDVSASVQFSSSTTTVSVPLTLRGQVPARNTTFTGTFTGGNGRGNPGVSEVYYLTVPSGKKDLGVSLKLSDPNQLVFMYLTGPDGQVYSFGSNVNPKQTKLLSTIQLYRRNPAPGRWVLSLNITNPVSGMEVQQAFTVKVAYNTVSISAPQLPDSATTQLAAGVPVNVPVKVKNTGNAPLVFFADARLNAKGTIPLAELSGVSQPIPLPTPDGVTPFWLDPTETTSLTLVATADQPVNADFFYQSGNPDRYSAAVGNGATVTVTGPQVSPGLWETDIGQSGPFPGPAPAGNLTVSASAFGNLFDSAVTSDTGDFWQVGVDPAAMAAQAALARAAGVRLLAANRATAGPSASPAADPGPLVLNPGQTGTIMVTITPDAPHGTHVKGHLYIDTVDLFTDGGQELISLPYEYKVN